MYVELTNVTELAKERNPGTYRFNIKLRDSKDNLLMEVRGFRYYSHLQDIDDVRIRINRGRWMSISILGGIGKPHMKRGLLRVLEACKDKSPDETYALATVIFGDKEQSDAVYSLAEVETEIE